MKLWREGEKSVGMCEACRKRVATTFAFRPYALDSPAITVPDVLVSVCDGCGGITDVPYQSTPKIAAARAAAGVGRFARSFEKFEARIPRELEDALGLIALEYRTLASTFLAPLVRFYVREIGRDEGLASFVRTLSRDPVAGGSAKGRLSVNVDSEAWEAAWERAKVAGIATKAEFARGLILAAAVDAGLHEPTCPDEVCPRRDSKSRKASERRKWAVGAIAISI